MGVAFVTQLSPDEGKNVQQSLEDLKRVVEKIGGKKSGLYCVECETYQSNINQGKTLNIITNSEYPLSRFAQFEDGPVVIADQMLPNFLSKLRQFWQQRKGAKIECKGSRYVFSDFLLKVGIVTHGSNTRGIALEVEYTPCVHARECWALLTELLQSVIGNQAPSSEPQFFQQMKPGDVYTPEHTSFQYIDLFNNFRKGAM